jgi:hypothetical protein
MKNFVFIVIIIVILSFLYGCGAKNIDKDNSSQGTTADQPGFEFNYNNIAIHMNDKADKIVDALGKPQDYFEAPSCAFQGLDKIYYYSGFNLSTYPGSDGDYVLAIDFSDDSVSTKEGITLGAARDKVVEAYGKDYTEDNGSLIYTKGKTKLTFLMEGDAVTSINYEFITN